MRGFEKLSVADIERRNLKISEPKRHKYGAEKTPVDGYTFDSKKEASRYLELKILLKAKQIYALDVQPVYPCSIHTADGQAIWVCDYRADFRYYETDPKTQLGIQVVEDVKSKATRTAVYRLKKKLVEAIYGIEITEI